MTSPNHILERREINKDDLNGKPLKAVIEFLQGAYRAIPKQFRDLATLDIDTDEWRVELTIEWQRPETDDERCASQEATSCRHMETRERERREYERLRAKFEAAK